MKVPSGFNDLLLREEPWESWFCDYSRVIIFIKKRERL
jgi:hypothetical protein